MSDENPELLRDTDDVTREELFSLIRRLPEKKLPEAEALLFDLVEDSSEDIVPVSVKEIWAGVAITEAEFAKARKEMWGNFGERVWQFADPSSLLIMAARDVTVSSSWVGRSWITGPTTTS